MTIRETVKATAICACISLFAFTAGPCNATAENASGLQQTGTLPGGAQYVLRRDEAAATTAIELWFRAPAAGYDSKYPGISRLALTAIAATRPAHGTSVAELVTRMGGTLTLNVYPDIAMVGVSVPSWQATQVMRALTAAYFSPSISDEALRSALRDCAIAAAESRFDADRVLQDTLFSHMFASGPAHFPPTPGSASDFSSIPGEEVRAFALRAFRQNNAVLSMAGSAESKLLSEVRAGGVTGKSMDAPYDSTLSNRAVDLTQDAQVPGLGVAWAGPGIDDAKAATALDFVADYLFDAEHGTVSLAARKRGDAFVNGQFITLHNPGVLLVTVSGKNSGGLRDQVLNAVVAMNKPLDAKAFESARNAFIYHIMSQVQTPSSRADNFGWYAAEGNLEYAPGSEGGAYVKAAQSLDPGYVAEIVRKYLQRPAIVQLTTAAKPAQGTTI